MKKFVIFMTIFFSILLVSPKDVFAYSSDNYRNRALCGTFEVASFKSDGSIVKASCHSTYEQAKSWMKSNGGADLAIMTRVGGTTKIIDANEALLDLSVNPETLTYFYTNANLTGSSYTYMDTGSLYGGVDGALLDSAYSSVQGKWVAKVKTGNFTGWIEQSTYEVVPLTWVKSSSSYTITADSIRHNYVAKIQNTYSGNAGSTIGPKPEMLSTGTYYSYDGHYFYKDLKTLVKDYKNGNYNNAVNKNNPYYNYYMYLSNHTRTSYSSINIDEYIRNNMGITQDVYGNESSNNNSRLYGKGTFFYYAQEKYGVNAILALSLSRNETGNGRSHLAINKNNGFGLNAVDSNPTQAANWYASFADSILGYASKWITYGYAHPRDWRYFGPQFGDKWIGMNVKYASDTYWSEKMAANYYSLDKAKGMQDYNYYQLGVVTRQVNAYQDATSKSKFIYSYPEAEDGVVIIGEKQGESINGNTTWYKVISDLNIDANYNEITSGNYNWNGAVYIPATYVKKINTGKKGYISPNNVTAYQNKDYSYDLSVENATLKPKIGITTKQVNYYYDSSLQSKKNQILLKDRYVMVYAIAYDKNHNVISYLVTSDYKYDQKEWVSADAIRLVSGKYGKVSVTAAGNQYTWVNSVPEDTKATLISGQYTNSYVPVLEQKNVNGYLWYKVPVNLSGTNNQYGWTLASAPNVAITLVETKVVNQAPVIYAEDKTIVQGTNFNKKENVRATDNEDGDITSKITITEDTVNIDRVGEYKITYQVMDNDNNKATKTIKVTVTENRKPVIEAEDTEITKGHKVEIEVHASDAEDGDLTAQVQEIENTVNNEVLGDYKIVYQVTDSYHQTTTKEIKVSIVKDRAPVIEAEDQEILLNQKFDALEKVKAHDIEDGDITKNIKVIKNNVKTEELGEYQVVYEVEDSAKNKTTKEIKVKVVEKLLQQKEGTFYFNYLKEKDGNLELQGYQTIVGINNTLDTQIEYEIILEEIETKKEVTLKADRIEKEVDIPKKVYSADGKDYTYSWFNAEMNMDEVPVGNYKAYMKAIAKEEGYYSKSLITNKTYNNQTTKLQGEKHSTLIGNNYDTSTSFVEFRVREDDTLERTGSFIYNQYEKYTKFEFVDNQLYLRGNSYSYGMDLGKNKTVKRNIIFENMENYETYIKELSSITDGNYQVILPTSDNLDKTRAWYDKKIDLSILPKGKYVIYIATESNIKDVSEMKEKLGRSLDSVKATIDNKKYSFKINKERGNRIELTVA